MTPLERLLAEEIPTGTFGGPKPHTPPATTHGPRTTTPVEAAEHVAALEAALTSQRARHLRAVPTTESEAA